MSILSGNTSYSPTLVLEARPFHALSVEAYPNSLKDPIQPLNVKLNCVFIGLFGLLSLETRLIPFHDYNLFKPDFIKYL